MNIPLSGIDGGREGLWLPGKWARILQILSIHQGTDIYDEENHLYSALEGEFPSDRWRAHEEGGAFRPLFRDYSHPWTRTGVLSLTESVVTISPLGNRFLTGQIGYQEVLRDFITNYTDDGDHPLLALAQLLGEDPGEVFSADDICTKISATSGTEKRRTKLALKIFDYSNLIGEVDTNHWVVLDHGFPSKNKPAAALRAKVTPDCALSLCTKSFLILTGLSGSGKTRCATVVSQALSSKVTAGTKNPQIELIPVGPDWNNRDQLLGYPDGLDPKRYITTSTLALLLRAKTDSDKPYFLILDEMNLSHVERYFADFLSAMESDGRISLYEGNDRYSKLTGDGDGDTDHRIPTSIHLPKNLFIIGTVNVDETTYQFSPKVLDRANVIEFRMDDKSVMSFFATSGPDAELSPGSLEAEAENFVSLANTEDADAVTWAAQHEIFSDEMKMFFDLLQVHDAEFGYRTLKETSRYLYFYNELSDGADLTDVQYRDAMDDIIIQKLLPKLHGSRSKMEGLLRALAHACAETDRTDWKILLEGVLDLGQKHTPSLEEIGDLAPETARYPNSHAKIRRMCRKLARDQFVSFADA